MARIAVGLWTPRTRAHLLEFYNLMKGVKPHPLYSGSVEHVRREFNPEVVELSTLGSANFVRVKMGDKEFIYYDFGLMYVISEKEPTQSNINELYEFFKKFLKKVISPLYIAGAPVPKLLARERGYVIGGIVPDPWKAFEEFGGFLVERTKLNGKEVVIGDKCIFVQEGENDQRLLEFLIFRKKFFEFMEDVLVDHRILWEKIDRVRENANPVIYEVGELKDKAEEVQEALEFIKARLKQAGKIADAVYDIYSKFIPEIKEEKIDVKAMHEYMDNLLDLTIKYNERTFKLLDLLYGEVQRRDLEAIKAFTFLFSLLSIVRMGIKTPLPFVDVIKVVFVVMILAIIFYYLLNRIIKFTRKFRRITIKVKKVEDIEEVKKHT